MRPLILLIFLSASLHVFSQQQALSTTISSVKIINKASPTSTVVVNGKYVMKTSPEVIVNVVDMDKVSKIYLEILKKDSSLVYQVDYNINSQVILNGNRKLFERNDKQVLIAGPEDLIRDIYIYKVYTTNGNQASKPFYLKN